MNRRLIWGAVVAVAAVTVSASVLAQDRQGQSGKSTQAEEAGEKAALAEHKAQEERERAAAAERAKRRDAARAGQDPRQKAAPKAEEEEEKPQRDPR